jgi:shikimate kinase
MTKRSDSLVLIGPMGSGKTSVGRRVAKKLGESFVDTDAMVVREHGPIADLFAATGEAHFRELEREAVRAALEGTGVIALGGGAVLDADTQADLQNHRVVFLTVSPRVIARRVEGSNRPLLHDGDALERWTTIFAERLPLYESLASVTFDTSSGPLSDIVDAIAAWAARPETSHQEQS